MGRLPVKSILIFGFVVASPLAVFAVLFAIIVNANFVTDIESMRASMQAPTGMNDSPGTTSSEVIELPRETALPLELPPALEVLRVTDKTGSVRASNPSAAVDYCRAWSLQHAPKLDWETLGADGHKEFSATVDGLLAALQHAAAQFHEEVTVRDGEHPKMGQRSISWHHWDPELQLESWVVAADVFERHYETGLPIVAVYLEHCQAAASNSGAPVKTGS